MLPTQAFRALALAVSSLVPLAVSSSSLAQVPSAPDVPNEIANAPYAAVGVINANNVFVRSGPSDNDYPVLKLDRGTRLTVKGMNNDWLKVTPPPGTFCLVAKAFVDRRGDGTIGRVNNTLYVRVGSRLNDLRTKVAMKLEPNADVKIIDEKDEYFMIEPPEGVFLFVNKRFVDPVAPADTTPPAPTPPTGITPPTPLAQNDQATTPADAATTQVPPGTDSGAAVIVSPDATGSTAVTPPAATGADPLNAQAAPATRPTNATAELQQKFQDLETLWRATQNQEIQQQPLEQLLAGYTEISSNPATPTSMKQLADIRLKTVQLRSEMLAEFNATLQRQKELEAARQPLVAEAQELEQRRAASAVTSFVAVGTLRPSSLQFGGQMLYRLTDPSSGRTVIYLRSNDPALAMQIGQFVGIRGNVTDEPRMRIKYVEPTAVETVDPTKVNNGVVATYVPASLQPTGTAATPNE